MKKVLTFLIAAFITVFAFGGVVFAAEEKVVQISGDISAVYVNLTKFSIKSQSEPGETTYKVTGSTKITSGGVSKALSDVKVGDKAAIEYVEKYQGRTRICKSLDIK
ncbi:MAG: hypothetical protein HY096_01150 [Nitrospinae bacterium]|nr:hypothetical protein [Nitrospinota bacterium]